MPTTRTSKTYPIDLRGVAIPPGESIAELAVQMGYGPQQLASELQLSPGELGQLLCGDLPLTAAVAEKLHVIFGQRTDFWLRLEAQYREDLAFQAAAAKTPKRKRA